MVYGSNSYYYLYNVQGDVIALARASTGKVVATYAYDAWGNCTVTNASGYTVRNKNPFRYRGYYFDTETGLYYLNSRYYSPEFGRFISADDAYDLGIDNDYTEAICSFFHVQMREGDLDIRRKTVYLFTNTRGHDLLRPGGINTKKIIKYMIKKVMTLVIKA